MTSGSGTASIEPVRQVSLPPITPGRGWYWVALAVSVLGLVAAFALLAAGAFRYLGAIDDLERVELPGRATVDATGSLRLYHEPEGGRVANLGDLMIHVEDPEGERVIVPVIAAAGERYDVEGRFGVLVGEIGLPAPGPSVVVAEGQAPGRLAIGRSPSSHLRAHGLGALAVAVCSVGVGLVIGVVTRRRRRASLAERLDASMLSSR